MGVKNKISKVKRTNQKRQKPNRKKQTGAKTTKKFRSKKVPEKSPVGQPDSTKHDEEDSDAGEDLLDMVENEDLTFLKQAIADKSYSIFDKIQSKESKKKSRKRKLEDDDALEQQFENQQVDDEFQVKNLLPIKTPRGILPRKVLSKREEDPVDESSQNKAAEPQEVATDEAQSDEDADFTFVEDKSFDPSQPVSVAEVLGAREGAVKARKLQIGTLCSRLLETPEEKVLNLKALINIMGDKSCPVYQTSRKLVMVSLLEVFKDLLPEYQIKHHESGDALLKKETRMLQKYESQLLLYYKKYLQKLERTAMEIMRKVGDNRTRTLVQTKMAELSIHCLCELLITHPYFNFSQNIAQTVMPFLNHKSESVRKIVYSCCQTIFKEDKKGEITLKILRILNQYIKKRAHNVHADMLQVLLYLKIKDVDLDEDKKQEMKEKKLMAQKQRLIVMSRKERKRKKKLKEVEQELLETQAQESKEVKQKYMTEITKIVFGIYFRILKSSQNTKVLGVCLEGLAKFAFCINLEFYSDIVNVLNHLLHEDFIGYREQLFCIHTVLVMLSGQGEALNLDPSRFYRNLYEHLLTIHCGRNQNIFPVLLQVLMHALIKRRKKVTNQRLVGFVKRIGTLSLQLMHHGTLSALSLVKTMIQQCRHMDVLLDTDTNLGDGIFQPEVPDPECSNAGNTALYELVTLLRHYHPVVAKMARHIVHGVPTAGQGSLPPDIGKLTAEELFEQFNPETVVFKPAVPIPKKCQPKSKSKRHRFTDSSFEDYCKRAARRKLHKSPCGLYFAV